MINKVFRSLHVYFRKIIRFESKLPRITATNAAADNYFYRKLLFWQ
uniref:Uncharacterized protein n=3 Tax=Klebsiella TaxID=570 RepID=A0A345WX72_KLEOX|nr:MULTISPECIES: hypothetical protein [Klebsiella]AVX35430.1 Hypothetical protein [Klebsiella aerogenes]AXJ98275.1 hypothetical protein [Klebsiella oxytoca]AXJ98620.1 hypothetical protein [Klebsiella pneumoniae]QAX88273.1 hypothetical protein [Klebsiella pneumoniae]QEQ68966.1 hypothetical protein [Klebsiella pneumoniae]